MRIQNSYAAAVAAAVSAVVFSAAFQPAANAAPIVIDSFTNQSTNTIIAKSFTPTAFGQTTYLSTPTDGLAGNATGSLFPTRTFTVTSSQGFSGPFQTLSGTFNTVSGTSLTMVIAKGAGGSTPAAILNNEAALTYSAGSPVNLAALGFTPGNPNAKITIKKSAGSASPGSGNLIGDITISDGTNTSSFFYNEDLWYSNQTLDTPLSSFPGIGSVDLTSVNSITLRSYRNLGDVSQAFTGSVTFTEVSIVPEPTHLVLVAGAGAVLGAWRLRKLRRSREAAGDAIAS
jgi:hypothetical protein